MIRRGNACGNSNSLQLNAMKGVLALQFPHVVRLV